MKNLVCPACKSRVYFESVSCLNCGRRLGFDPDTVEMCALEPVSGGNGSASLFRKVRGKTGTVRICGNEQHGVCNWLVPSSSPNQLCRACALNRTIPNLSEPGGPEAWSKLERAKKRLIYSLLRLGLPFEGNAPGVNGLVFDFMSDTLTGHSEGLITVDLMETDAVERERRRKQFDEPYRNLLGHLRHESGHYYWMLLVQNSSVLEPFRALFGDERQNYQESLGRYYANGPEPDWSKAHVSAYASAHPWEDWAETWAHYLHMVDAVETAEAEGLDTRPASKLGLRWMPRGLDIYRQESFEGLMCRWIPLSLALNSLNRSLGHRDAYPFVLLPAARRKLEFVHNLVRRGIKGQVSAFRSDVPAPTSGGAPQANPA
jgi:hypothetical protein